MPPKRKTEAAAAEPVVKRRSARQAQKSSGATAAVPQTEANTSKTVEMKEGRGRGAGKSGAKAEGAVTDAPRRVAKGGAASKGAKPAANPKTSKVVKKEEERDNEGARGVSEDPDVESIPARNPEVEHHEGEWYWLMKAEPETRLENGIDVSFSIDDLRAREVPEPWDGIRAYAARNNMRAMNAGDKAFFYHSNCKEPGIVGIMEVVKEFSEDRTARRPGAPYYDPSSTKEKPKWGLVHVEFVKKFAVPITLRELKEMGAQGKLGGLQMLKQSRLSVSRVGAEEWEYLCGLADEKAREAGLEHEV